ncbi:hypothetical protein ACJRO7_014310 [Eucalyptus globulus]|uniref:TIR domain-containing protein n=1 Tax=Eucalyptus globulus TaxID=34317 RepID=A0ABD3L0M2_EUCGL
MMYIQSRKRKMVFPFFSFLSNSFLFFSLHFPLNLNCQSNCKREKPTHSEDSNSGVSSSLTAPHGRDHEGGDEQPKGNAYEVFLSFRGKDTRKGFTDYLYNSLVNAGIHVFKDDNELRVGEEIGPELLCSITQSTISIPIISENYVTSKWCLRELVQMLKCKRSKGQKVLPIFYKVEPHQVRHLTGRLRKAIDAHKKNTEEMVVKEWEDALKEVSSLKGWESEKIDNGHEGTLVKIIVEKVMGELKRLFLLNVPEQLVGIEDHVQPIMSNIDAEFNGTKIIGIYGMGGIGKTTLAKVLYNRLSSHFNCRSFVANIRETSERKGIECVQKQLIYDITGRSCDVSNVDEGVNVIKSRFMSKKVLVLLDDMDDNTHLNALVKDGSWFEVGSVVIITTRNKSILVEGRDYMYQLNELSLDQSLILFSRHAFRKDYPPDDYKVISHDVVSTTAGLPLALEVIGSFLCGKRKDVWKGTLKRLEKVPHEKVREKLKISYDALDYRQQQIFLDIACLFVGSHQQNPTYMWDACDFFPGMGIEVLSLMSLIKIDEHGKLLMHDQLRDLGREIIYLENPREPQERSRLWIYEEALDVFDNCKGTRKIEALSLGKCGMGRTYAAKQLEKMTNLRFLQADGVDFTGDFQSLLLELRWLRWKYCPSNFGVDNFHLKKLVLLDLSESAILEDWGGWDPLKMATELKVLNLERCKFLKKTPDLSTFKRLEILNLASCENLEELHHSIGDIKTLVSLNVSGCGKLKELPKGIGRMIELRDLNIGGTGIQDIPILSDCLMKELKVIIACGCLDLVHIPSSIGNLASLQRLELGGCRSLKEIPDSIGNLASLVELDLKETLITKLPESIGNLQNLRMLCIDKTNITELPDAIGMLTKLQKLEASDCKNLEQLPSNICELIALERLFLVDCEKLQELPELPSGLTELWITCQGQSLPHLSQLTRLKTLFLHYCHRLERVPKLPIGLWTLYIRDCGKLKAFPNLSDLKHLRFFRISESPSLEESPDVLNFRRTQMRELGLKETRDSWGSLIFERGAYISTVSRHQKLRGGRREGGQDVHGMSLSLSIPLLVGPPAGFPGPKIEATVRTAHPPQAGGQVSRHGGDDDGDGDGDEAMPRLATPSPSAPDDRSTAFEV